MNLFGLHINFRPILSDAQKLANAILSDATVKAEVRGTISFLEQQALKGVEKLEKAALAAIPTIAGRIPVIGEVSKSVAILVVQTVYNEVDRGVGSEVQRLLTRLGL